MNTQLSHFLFSPVITSQKVFNFCQILSFIQYSQDKVHPTPFPFFLDITIIFIEISKYFTTKQKLNIDSLYDWTLSWKWSIYYKWRPPNLSELTPITFNKDLTHLGSEASKLAINDIMLFFDMKGFIINEWNCIFLWILKYLVWY